MKCAVITGASSGLGAEFARQTAKEGRYERIILIARRAERLEKLAGAMDAIRAKYGKGAIAPASCPRDPGEDRHAPPPGGKDYLQE